MSYIMVMNKAIICCYETEVTCPHCSRVDNGEAWEEALQKSKRGYIYRKCPGCGRKLFITSDMTGDLVASEITEKKLRK
jgi:phage FluMu protein Com